MKEFVFKINDFTGLRSVEGVQLNTSGLAGAINFRVEEGRASTMQPPNLLGKLPDFCSFPFPQLGVVDGRPLIFDQGAVYKLSSSQRPQLCIGGLTNSGYPWSWAWMVGFALFTNYRVVLEQVLGVWSHHSRQTVPQCRALAQFGGQFIAGNTGAYGEIQSDRVMWAKPGTIDFRIDESQEAGSLIVRGVGEILALSEMSSGVVVYGTEGVALLTPQSHPIWYGQKMLSGDGVAGQLAHCGDESDQYFVSTSGYLHHIPGLSYTSQTQGSVKVLGYKYYLGPASKQEISLSYDSVRKEVYILG